MTAATPAPLRVLVLVSGRGSNLKAIAAQASSGALPITIVAVVSDRADAGALPWAAERGIPTAVLAPQDYPDREAYGRALGDLVDCVEAGREIPMASRVRYRYEASRIVDKAVAIVGELFANAGGRSVFLGSPIQQRFLDVNTARAHVANNPVPFSRNLGGVQLGMDSTDVFV